MMIKKSLQLLVFIALSLSSVIAHSAISSEGWFYKARYFSGGIWHTVLKGAYENSEKCNKALTDSTVWDVPPYAVHGSCRFYYSDEYDALDGAITGKVGIAPTTTLTLSGDVKLQFIEKFTQLNDGYEIEGYRSKLNLLIRSAFKLRIGDPDNDDEDDDEIRWSQISQAEELLLISKIIKLNQEYNIQGYQKDLQDLIKQFM